MIQWICKVEHKKIEEGGQDSNLEPYNQVVKVGEGWVDLGAVVLTICLVAK